MRFQLIEGMPQTLVCSSCNVTVIAGTLAYMPANGRGVPSLPSKAYLETTSGAHYCESCAEKLATAEDSTKAITRFYSDTKGLNLEV